MENNKSRFNRFSLLIIPCVLILTSLIGWISVRAISDRNNNGSYNTMLIQELQRLYNETNDPEVMRSLEVKISILQSEATDGAVAALTPREKPADPCALRPVSTEDPDSNRIVGISDKGAIPFHSTDLTISNSWSGKINGFWTHVYAGASFEDKEQGVVVVNTDGMYLGGRYFSPTKGGMLKIVSEENFRLTLVDENGNVSYFVVPGQMFVSSPDEVVPTLTPADTYPPAESPCLMLTQIPP
jgi:hypothetical protein